VGPSRENGTRVSGRGICSARMKTKGGSPDGSGGYARLTAARSRGSFFGDVLQPPGGRECTSEKRNDPDAAADSTKRTQGKRERCPVGGFKGGAVC